LSREEGEAPPKGGGTRAHARARARDNLERRYGAGVAAHEILIWSDYI
jgi:hypothetical protein